MEEKSTSKRSATANRSVRVPESLALSVQYVFSTFTKGIINGPDETLCGLD